MTLRLPLSQSVYARHKSHRPLIQYRDGFGQLQAADVPAHRLVAQKNDVVPIDRLLGPRFRLMPILLAPI